MIYCFVCSRSQILVSTW